MRSADIQSNRRTQTGSNEGETGCRLPLMVFQRGARAMTLVEDVSPEILREASTPVLETERLTLRVPRLEDAKAIAQLANDRRIAENTTRIPFPYRRADAEAFVAQANIREGDLTLLITFDGAPIGACGLTQLDGP